MIAFFIIGIIITIAISFFLVRKIENNTYRICIFIANIIVLMLFIASGSTVGFVKKNLDSFLNLQISRLEAKANEIYPGSLDAQMDTSEIKSLLQQSLTVKTSDSPLEDIVLHIIKANIDDFASATLKTIGSLERIDNRQSVKDALISLKEICVKKINPFFKTANIILSLVFFIYIICSFFLSLYLSSSKTKENKTIIFGETARQTTAGMKTEN